MGFLYLCIHVEPISTINVVHRQTDTYMQRERESERNRERDRETKTETQADIQK